MPIYFIATTNGRRADGFLIASGATYAARSGRLLEDTAPGKKERGEVPAGVYQIGRALDLSAGNALTMTDGSGNLSRFKKFAIEPTRANREWIPDKKGGGMWGVRDTRYPNAPRSLLRFHYDGDRPGSEGCIVYDDIRAQESLNAAQRAGDSEVRVEYLETQDAVRARVTAITGRPPPG